MNGHGKLPCLTSVIPQNPLVHVVLPSGRDDIHEPFPLPPSASWFHSSMASWIDFDILYEQNLVQSFKIPQFNAQTSQIVLSSAAPDMGRIWSRPFGEPARHRTNLASDCG